MLDRLLRGKFFSKCKSDIELIRTRIDIIKKKRNAMQKYLRNDVAELLKNGFDVQAFSRAGGLLTEMTRSQCYELIDQYCEHILTNLSAMNKQRECPEECREAASSLMYAAARIADLPELRDLRTMFSERYGKSLDYYVNKQFSNKLKSDPPSNEMKFQLLEEIAAESGLEWDSKSLENELFNKPAFDKKLVKDHDRVDGSARKDLLEATRDEDRFPNEAKPVSPVSNKRDEDEPFRHKMFPPPYTKPELDKSKSSSSEESDSSKEREREREVSVAQGRRILRFFDGGGCDQRDDEDKVLDRLLRYYSRKRGLIKSGKTEQDNGQKASRDGPIRASSFSVEPTSPSETPKQHARATSLHHDSNAAHVHPKLPDYDEFLARLEAFRGK